MCLKACATRQHFSVESTASALMSGDILELCIERCIDVYRVRSSSKRHLINLAYLGVKLKKALTITHEAS